MGWNTYLINNTIVIKVIIKDFVSKFNVIRWWGFKFCTIMFINKKICLYIYIYCKILELKEYEHVD